MTYLIKLELDDGAEITLGGGDELFVTLGEGETSVTLNDATLKLVADLQKVQEENS